MTAASPAAAGRISEGRGAAVREELSECSVTAVAGRRGVAVSLAGGACRARALARPGARQGLAERRAVGIEQPLGQLPAGSVRQRLEEEAHHRGRRGAEIALLVL